MGMRRRALLGGLGLTLATGCTEISVEEHDLETELIEGDQSDGLRFLDNDGSLVASIETRVPEVDPTDLPHLSISPDLVLDAEWNACRIGITDFPRDNAGPFIHIRADGQFAPLSVDASPTGPTWILFEEERSRYPGLDLVIDPVAAGDEPLELEFTIEVVIRDNGLYVTEYVGSGSFSTIVSTS